MGCVCVGCVWAWSGRVVGRGLRPPGHLFGEWGGPGLCGEGLAGGPRGSRTRGGLVPRGRPLQSVQRTPGAEDAGEATAVKANDLPRPWAELEGAAVLRPGLSPGA